MPLRRPWSSGRARSAGRTLERRTLEEKGGTDAPSEHLSQLHGEHGGGLRLLRLGVRDRAHRTDPPNARPAPLSRPARALPCGKGHGLAHRAPDPRGPCADGDRHARVARSRAPPRELDDDQPRARGPRRSRAPLRTALRGRERPVRPRRHALGRLLGGLRRPFREPVDGQLSQHRRRMATSAARPPHPPSSSDCIVDVPFTRPAPGGRHPPARSPTATFRTGRQAMCGARPRRRDPPRGPASRARR